MELVLVALGVLLGIAIGYLWRQPEGRTVVERVRVQFVDKPVLVPVAPTTVAAPTAQIVLMDANERTVKAVETIEAKLRRPTIYRGTHKYMCSRQDADGRFVYRPVAH